LIGNFAAVNAVANAIIHVICQDVTSAHDEQPNVLRRSLSHRARYRSWRARSGVSSLASAFRDIFKQKGG
jgi:hypothetical protein